MTRLAALMIGVGWSGIVAAGLWASAYAAWAVNREPPTIEPPIINHQQQNIDRSPSMIDGRYVASTLDKKTMVYHLAGECHYARKITNHRRSFDSSAEAEAAGYKPCRNCLPQIASAASAQ